MPRGAEAPRLAPAAPSGLLARVPEAVVALLLATCLWHGLSTTAGLAYPPDEDMLRDMGAAQALLDGNLFGDPTYSGEWRWYPPLVPALMAGLYRLSGADGLARFWVAAGPWLNLLAPLLLFLMGRRLIGAPAAAIATAILVVFNGALSEPWQAGGYSPWAFTPFLVQGMFFAGLWLLHARVATARWRDAALIGLVIGLVFLAHAVPALLLATAATLAALAVQGLRWRTLLWIGLVGAVALLIGLPYLAPIALHYPGGPVNPLVTGYVDWLLKPPPRLWLLVVNAPGLAGLLATAVLWRRAPLGRATTAILAAWIGICVLFLGRHYACAALAPTAGPGLTACRVFAVAVHHYHLYLQLAWTLLMGHVAWQVARLWAVRLREGGRGAVPWRAGLAAGLALLLLAVGCRSVLRRPFDRERRASVLAGTANWIDADLYRWVLAHTRPDTLFATEPATPWKDGRAFAVIAAGRKLVAAPAAHSNPFLLWAPRDARRRAVLAAAAGEGPVAPLCEGAPLLVLGRESPAAPARVEAVLATPWNTLYRPRPEICRTEEAPEADQHSASAAAPRP